jgi:hypothetical protein
MVQENANTVFIIIFPVAQQPNSGPGRFVLGVYRSHTIKHTNAYGRSALNER